MSSRVPCRVIGSLCGQPLTSRQNCKARFPVRGGTARSAHHPKVCIVRVGVVCIRRVLFVFERGSGSGRFALMWNQEFLNAVLSRV